MGGASLDENGFAVRTHPSPVGRRIHVIGNSSSGKSTLAGRLAKALAAKFVFRDENALHDLLAIVSGVLPLFWGLKAYRELQAAGEGADAVGR